MASYIAPSPGKPPEEKPKQPFSEASADAWLGRQLKPLLDWFKSPEWLKWLWGLVEYVFSRLLMLLLELAATIGAKIATAMAKGEERANPAFQELTAAAIYDLLGVRVQIGPLPPPGQRGPNKNVARDIGDAVLKAFFGPYASGGATQLRPSDAGARDFLSMVTGLAFEGWLEGWIFEALSLGQLERFADLDDTLIAALGLGRLSRRALAAPMDILIETPYRWLLNKTFRPSELGSAEACRQYFRGRWARERLNDHLARMGYSDESIEAILTTAGKQFSPSEVDYLVARGAWTHSDALRHLQDQGYTQMLAETELAMAEDRRLDTYRRSMAAEAISAYEKRDIERDQLERILLTSEIPESERRYMVLLGGLRRELRSKSLSLSNIEQAVKRGILSINDFRAAALREGYSLADTRTLELLLMTEIAETTEAEKERERLKQERVAAQKAREEEAKRRRAEIEAELKVRELNLGQMEALVRRGLRTLDQYRQFLRDLKYTPEDVTALAELLAGQMAEREEEEKRREELRKKAAERRVSIADLERAVTLGLMTVDEYRSQLAAAGFVDEDRDLLARILQRELDLAAEEARRRAEAAARLAERHISLADVESATRRGLRSVAQYRDYLIEQGFSPEDADLLAALVRMDIEEDEAARKRREEIEKRLAKKKISLSDIERAVRAGVQTVAQYRALLLREGYTEEDADLLVRLLELQIAADKQAAKQREEVEKRLAERRISLPDVERAVKLGVMDLAGYKAVLKREGFPAEDQAILTQLLLTEIAAVKEAERKRTEAEAAAKKRQISLGDLERAVRLGLRTMVEYQATLAGLGYGPQDQATLMGLLQLQMSQDQAAQRKREQAERELAVKGLSLPQFERSVVEGVRTMAEYRVWLQNQGYRVEDVATLVSLLQLALDARAARESAQ